MGNLGGREGDEMVMGLLGQGAGLGPRPYGASSWSRTGSAPWTAAPCPSGM